MATALTAVSSHQRDVLTDFCPDHRREPTIAPPVPRGDSSISSAPPV